MNTDSQLPKDVLEAIHANRKIDAIKLLREHEGFGLKEAKHAVDDYIRQNRQLIRTPETNFDFRRLALIGVVVAVLFALYRQFVA